MIPVKSHVRSYEEQTLEDTIKRKFGHLSNKQLINRINSRYKSGLNDDDEVFEMTRRSDAGLLRFKAGYDTYELIE